MNQIIQSKGRSSEAIIFRVCEVLLKQRSRYIVIKKTPHYPAFACLHRTKHRRHSAALVCWCSDSERQRKYPRLKWGVSFNQFDIVSNMATNVRQTWTLSRVNNLFKCVRRYTMSHHHIIVSTFGSNTLKSKLKNIMLENSEFRVVWNVP